MKPLAFAVDSVPHAAGILLTHGRRALFVKRSDKARDHAGEWCCPGGSIEGGETAEQAARRELTEETGLTGLLTGDLSQIDEGEGFVTFRQNVNAEADPTLNEEHDEARWASMDDPPQPLHPGVAATLRKMAQSTGLSALESMNKVVGNEVLTVGPSGPISAQDKREYDTNGWFEVTDNPLSSIGVYPYSEASVVRGGDRNKKVMVYRPEEELSDPETIKSFRLTPWTDDHPDAMLGGEAEGLVPAEEKGVHGVTGEQIYYKRPTLFGNIKLFSEKLARKLAAGKKELSCGYRCVFVPEEGEYEGTRYQYVQRKIRGNHFSSVDEGRMGAAVRVLDAVERFTFALDIKEPVMAEDAWNESDHPRRDNGEFGKGGGSSASKHDDELASYKDNGKGEYAFVGKTSGETPNPWDYSKGGPKYGNAGPTAGNSSASKSTFKIDPEKVKAAQANSARIAALMGHGGEDCSLDEAAFNLIADSFNSLVGQLEKKGYSKEYATRVAGEGAAEKGTNGHDSNGDSTGATKMSNAKDGKGDVKDPEGSAEGAMKTEEGMDAKEDESDKKEAAKDGDEEKKDKDDGSKDARDRKSARDRRAGARDARASARDARKSSRDSARDKAAKDALDRAAKDADADKDKDKDKGGMDAAAVSTLVEARLAKLPKVPTAEEIVAQVRPAIRREEAAKATLYGKVSPLIGAFDHADMTHEAMATYALDKLGAPKPPADPVSALDFYLAGRAQVASTLVTGHALDSRATSNPGFLESYITAGTAH